MKVRHTKKSGQVILETVVVVICLAVIAIASMQLFSNLNLSMLNRLNLYRGSRLAVMNSPANLDTRMIAVAPKSEGATRALSDPTTFLDYTGGVPGIIPDIPKAGFNWNINYLYEKDLIFELILRYKFNQAYWFARRIEWKPSGSYSGYYTPYKYIRNTKNLLKELYDKDTGYDPVYRNQEGLIKRGYDKMIELLEGKKAKMNAEQLAKLANATKTINANTAGINLYLNQTVAANIAKIATERIGWRTYRKPSQEHTDAVSAIRDVVYGEQYNADPDATKEAYNKKYSMDVFGPVPEGALEDQTSPFLSAGTARRLYYARHYLARAPNKFNLQQAYYWANGAKGYMTGDDQLALDVLESLLENLGTAITYRQRIDKRLGDAKDAEALTYYYNISRLQSWALYELAEIRP